MKSSTPSPTLKIYSVDLMVDEHRIEHHEIAAATARRAIDLALDTELAKAIRAGRPDLSIQALAIRGCRLAA